MPHDASITTSDDPLVSSAEAGRILGVTPVTIQRWAREGSIAAEKLPGKTGAYVLRQSEIRRIAADRAQAKLGSKASA